MLVTLTEILTNVANKDCALPGFNVFGYEDAIAVVRAAEELGAPVILMTNKVAIDYMPVKYLAKILCTIAEEAAVPVAVHLDHAKDFELVAGAIMNGYTSVMYDGSNLPLEENIKNTQEVVKLARACGVSVEAEIGCVGYSNQSIGFYTEPEKAKLFAAETKVDALAVAVGTLHRMVTQEAAIQFDRLAAIQSLVDVPLVIHGSTGIKDEDLTRIATYNVGKVNIGTALRMAFGQTLRAEMEKQPEQFDRIALFQNPMAAVQAEAKKKMKILGL
jgi:fructose-bisphosphate aldolase class II